MHITCAQGSKRPPGGTTGKKWNRGAPLSKKAKVKTNNNGQESAAAEQQNPQLAPNRLTTVPLPAAVEDIIHPGMQAYFNANGPSEVAPRAASE